MTSRRLRSAALVSASRSSPVFFLTLLLYGTAIWEFFQVFLLMPFSPLPISALGFLFSGLQALAGKMVWNLSKKGAILAAAVFAFRFAALGLQSLLFFIVGGDWLTLAGIFASAVVGLLLLLLLLLSWRSMR